ncbi:hypothetical protein M422DRAFT_23391 [Sphaerobolus stellatus SS14]|nr:hypothetical protein M422DRAFT_23391 [Sphaerobolus stellatus SS14]
MNGANGVNGHAQAGSGGSPYGNVLGLSHERTQSPTSTGPNEYPTTAPNSYPSYASYRSSDASYNAQSSSYPSSSAFSTTLPPIHSLESQQSSSSGSSNYMAGLGLGRVHPGPYPSYDAPQQTPQWSPPTSHHGHEGNGYGGGSQWWGNNGAHHASVGVHVGRGYAGSYGA